MTGTPFPHARTLDVLQADHEFVTLARAAVAAAVPLESDVVQGALPPLTL
ncbi:MAG: hypothetical protein ACREDO_13335 [Methyloceanibacter sp.]